MVPRDEFDALKLEVEALRRIVQGNHGPRIQSVEEGIDQMRDLLHETRKEVRVIGSDVGRAMDLLTVQAPVLNRVALQVARLVEILEPRSVVVEGGK